MGRRYVIMCAKCMYGIGVLEGIGFFYDPKSVFYGRDIDPSTMKKEGFFVDGKPLLYHLVEDERIKNTTFQMLAEGATPDDYGHDLYFCPECNRLENLFYYELKIPGGIYRPDYQCPACNTPLRRIRTKFQKDDQVSIFYRNNRKIAWKCPECGSNELVDFGWREMWD